jgi:adenine-specific DNA methylase
MRLSWHPYRYYEYERELALREIRALLKTEEVLNEPNGVKVQNDAAVDEARRLTYFAHVINGHGNFETTQALLENGARSGRKRQATRYSVHGLHEYKGKFNPQVARSILNIFNIRPGGYVLDPFCGSGTTLVECAHLGATGYGVDLNPLAAFIANAKMQALATPASNLRACLRKLSRRVSRRSWRISLRDGERETYLSAWFDDSVLRTIELLRQIIQDEAGEEASFFLAIASNLLRDYSLQDPNDLRIRRRKTPIPTTPFADAFLSACKQAIERLSDVQAVLGAGLPVGRAIVGDIASVQPTWFPVLFDAAITSPPYAMALPYIDTQRLSLVWLDLLPPNQILKLEGELTGSRELRGSDRKALAAKLRDPTPDLPASEARFCAELASALTQSDGFRRQAVPLVLNRYFRSMQASFLAVRNVLRPGAPYALIVGHNHTVLGGVRYDIDTPNHLASLAASAGWTVVEILPLQTYHRYGYHMNNAIAAESLLILRNGT